jgi:hypothetical protein
MAKYKITIGLVTALIFLGLIGYGTKELSGVEWRLSKKLKIQEGKYDCPPLTLCTFGNLDSDKVIFLYGDSHAAQLSNALNIEFGSGYKIYFFWAQGCFFGDVYPVPKSYYQPEYCGNIPQKISHLGLGKINIAITAQKWPGYGIKSKEDVENAIMSKTQSFGLHPDKLLIIGSTLDVDLRCAIEQYQGRIFSRRAGCETSQESFKNNEIFIKTTQDMILPKAISFIYPSPIVCPALPCKIIEGDISFYQDNSHLTMDGALKVVKQMKKLISVQ